MGTTVWLGHSELGTLMSYPNGDVKHVIGDEVSFGDIKVALTSVRREFKDMFLKESPRQQRYTESRKPEH